MPKPIAAFKDRTGGSERGPAPRSNPALNDRARDAVVREVRRLAVIRVILQWARQPAVAKNDLPGNTWSHARNTAQAPGAWPRRRGEGPLSALQKRTCAVRVLDERDQKRTQKS